MAEQQVTITNDLGLHLRAAGALVQLASKFNSNIWLKHGTTEANAKSIMSLLSLAAAKGTQLVLVAEGDDAQDAIAAISKLVGEGFRH